MNLSLVGPPPPSFEFDKFLRGSDFCQSRKGLVNGGVVLKRWRRSIFLLTNSFQCYFFWVFGVCVCIVSSLSGIRGGMIFVSSARQGGQLLNFKSQGGDTFRVEDDFRQSSKGGTALSWRIVGIFTKCFTLIFTNFACGAIFWYLKINMERYLKLDILFKIGIYRQTFLLTIDI